MILIGDWVPNSHAVVLRLPEALYLVNLEGPILPHGHTFVAAPKTGPSLASRELPKDGKFAFCLANNHMMDYGQAGLEVTLLELEKQSAKSCGAGMNIYDARLPLIVEDNGIQVGIISCCEAQFGVARHGKSGVAEFGPWIYQAIHDLRQSVDAVIVSLHAAIEDSPWPSPYIRELYHSFIDAGATVVHGHHSHVPQGYEVYNDGLILYGMGNFAVDPDNWHTYPNGMWSLGAEIEFGTHPLRWRPLTFEIRHVQGSDSIMIEEGNSEEQADHQRYLEICNLPLNEPELFAALWQEVALWAYYYYGAKYMGFHNDRQFRWRTLVKKSLLRVRTLLLSRNISSSFPEHQNYMLWHVMVACESHRQMLSTALGILSGEIKDLRTTETRRLVAQMMPVFVNATK